MSIVVSNFSWFYDESIFAAVGLIPSLANLTWTEDFDLVDVFFLFFFFLRPTGHFLHRLSEVMLGKTDTLFV